jgi:RNA polymerase sigma-70 factor (ECF subfamily)
MSDGGTPAPPGRRAFERGLEEHQRGLRTFARNLVGDAEEAHDIVQETFVDAWRATLREQAPFTPGCGDLDVRRWLYHVAYQRAISVRRRRGVVAWESLDACPGVESPVPADSSGGFEERLAEGDALRAEGDALRAAFARLAPEDAACLALKLVQGFAAPEIARILEITPEAARQRLSRALRRLRDAYTAQDDQRQAAGARPEERIRR